MEDEDSIDDAESSKRRLSVTLKQIQAEYPDFCADTFWTQIEGIAAQWITVFNPVLKATHRLYVRERESAAAGSATTGSREQGSGRATPAADARKSGPEGSEESDGSDDSDVHVPCAQLLGFDVLLSRKFKCHLLEVNNSPSLALDEVGM